MLNVGMCMCVLIMRTPAIGNINKAGHRLSYNS